MALGELGASNDCAEVDTHGEVASGDGAIAVSHARVVHDDVHAAVARYMRPERTLEFGGVLDALVGGLGEVPRDRSVRADAGSEGSEE